MIWHAKITCHYYGKKKKFKSPEWQLFSDKKVAIIMAGKNFIKSPKWQLFKMATFFLDKKVAIIWQEKKVAIIILP